MWKCYITGTNLRLSTNYLTVVITTYCALKIEELLNHKKFVIFSFLELRYIRGTYSKYFQNSFSEAVISSVTQKSTI